jgi:two-component system alkaline phosphatase synthesis response regulator PhoP
VSTSKRILVVDDEKGIRFLLYEALLREGFEVTLASDGQESLEKLQGDNFDLVITDINMPRLDGIEMLKNMKKTGRKEKVIIMTGNPSTLRLPHKDLPHIVSQLRKPFMIESLLSVVTAAMDVMEIPGENELWHAATA